MHVLGDAAGLRRFIEPEVEGMGFELVMVHLITGGDRRLQVFIDAVGGITLSDCEAVSRRLSPLLDVEDAVQGEYSLEVSSPGIDRPLVKPKHFQDVLGERVKIRMKAQYHGRRLFDGCLTEVRDDAAVLEIDGSDCALPYAGMERANLVGATLAGASS